MTALARYKALPQAEKFREDGEGGCIYTEEDLSQKRREEEPLTLRSYLCVRTHASLRQALRLSLLNSIRKKGKSSSAQKAAMEMRLFESLL